MIYVYSNPPPSFYLSHHHKSRLPFLSPTTSSFLSPTTTKATFPFLSPPPQKQKTKLEGSLKQQTKLEAENEAKQMKTEADED